MGYIPRLLHVLEEDLDVIYGSFRGHRNIFPHVRKDYLKREILSGNVIHDYGTILIYKQYQKKTQLGDVYAQKGDWIVKQILRTDDDGSPTKVLSRFIDAIDTRLFLTVRTENTRAIRFYQKLGLTKVGNITWSNGTIDGDVWSIA